MTTAQLRELDKRYVWHPFTPMGVWLESDPLVIADADGFYLIDSDGRRYLDGVSSLWCNVHGHRVPEIDEAIRRQLGRVAHSTLLGLANEPSILLAERLMRIAPPNLTKVFYSDSGATATEISFKLAAQYWYNLGRPEKHEFVAFGEAYHGDTVGAMSVGRMPGFHRAYWPLLFRVHFAPTPFEYRFHHGEHGGHGGRQRVKEEALAALRKVLGEHGEKIAAICIEPVVQGAGGMIVQPDGFLREVRRLADEFETLLICDEVATGFGRTGRMFAVEHEGVRPDLMTVAKGISGGYLPLAATLATQQIFDAFLGRPEEGKTFFHGHTYTGNPLACAAAIANLELMERRDTVGNVARNAPKLAEMLAPLKELPHVGDIRQKGYMVGIDLVADKATKQAFDPATRVGHAVCQRIRGRGVILRPLGDVIVLMPAPAMGVENLRTIVEAVRAEVAALRV
jgi:adenosylmethionine-8-amino-7-oxononanoate aminotransferase